MVEPVSIPRRKTSTDELSFDSLRSEAIKLLQEVSGQVWTDYNLHDPGVTILEQLIYALTDLIYRSELVVEDYLAGSHGRIDFAAQHLLNPAEIFSSRPTTELDYRNLMLNEVPAVDNLWLVTQPGTDPCRGVYRLMVKLAQDLDEGEQEDALEKLRKTYHARRNLCEDLDKIKLVTNLEYELHADIEVGSAHPPAELLAKIYFDCARCMASSVTITNYDQLVGQERPLDQLFDGPFTSHGFFMDEDTQAHRPDFLVSSLFATINDIEGVGHVRKLYLSGNGKDDPISTDEIRPEQALNLRLPWHGSEVKVHLTTNRRKLPTEIDEVKAFYDELKSQDYASRSTPQDLSLLAAQVTGTSRPLDRYFSVQNHFPTNYGINQQGVPASADPAVKARARQLKAYLLIFEQLMANFLANIDAVKILFSTRNETRYSYAVQALKPQQIDDLNAVYPQDAKEVLRRIIKQFDNYKDRKSRLLDYLLAMYGERFTQNSLRHFNFYYGKDEIDEVIVNNKIAYLEAIVELGRDRAAAPDYYATASTFPRSGLALRASMLLGFKQQQEHSLGTTFEEAGLELCTHELFDEQKKGSDEYRLFGIQELRETGYDRLEKLPLVSPGSAATITELRASSGEILPLHSNLLSDRLLSEGIYIERYRLASAVPDQGYRLYITIDDSRYWYLGDFVDKSGAIDAANDLRQLLLALNRDSEDLYIVEHLLLRPLTPAPDAAVGEDFYSFRISVIFPGWSARCNNLNFRNLAEETLRLNVPAHICPEFYWLDFAHMQDFERLYQKWQTLKTDRDTTPVDLDQTALQLVEFLRAQDARRQTGA